MKLKHVVATLAAMSVSAFGASITVTNNQGPVNTQSVVDNTGAAVEGGVAAIGSISDVGALATLGSGADLASLFTEFDGASGSVGSVGVFNGVYNFSNDGSSIVGSPFAGAPIYLVLGNGGDLASSTQAAVLEIGSFPTSEPAVSTIFVNNTSTVLLGDFDSFTLQPATVPRQNPALALVGIPEPSSSLLIGLAGLSLLIRRRR
jgi:hypothetical protein